MHFKNKSRIKMAGVVSICAVFCLVIFVILLMNVDPSPLVVKGGNETETEFEPEPLRRFSGDLYLENLSHTDNQVKEEELNVDQIVEEILRSSIAQLNNSSDTNISELSNSILTRLRGNLLKNIKRAIPKIFKSEEEVTKVKTKINTNVPEQNLIMNEDVVAINITDVLGQPLVELKLYSYKNDQVANKNADSSMV